MDEYTTGKFNLVITDSGKKLPEHTANYLINRQCECICPERFYRQPVGRFSRHQVFNYRMIVSPDKIINADHLGIIKCRLLKEISGIKMVNDLNIQVQFFFPFTLQPID